MTEDSWHRARLIPTSGIDGADEQERRATTALLAVIGAVREFGRALVQPLGAPDGMIETFTEVPFTARERKCCPDGLIQVRDGDRVWTALVEVRTGTTGLDTAQLETYVALAGEQAFDVVLTISNVQGDTVQSSLGLHHYSWRQVLAAAAQQERSYVDPDQAWLLGELIRYLEHPGSGVLESEDKGPVRSVDLRDPKVSVLRTVQLDEAEVRRPPTPPTRRDLRAGRRLGARNGSSARNDAGWYQDPHDPGQLRWWDGVGWTDGRYPAQPVLTAGDV
jgi:uncharacterized protein DUF2510